MPVNAMSAAPSVAATNWLESFEACLATDSLEAMGELFHDDSHWRDLVALTWHIRTFSGRDAIKGAMRDIAGSLKPRNFRICEERSAPRWLTRVGVDTLEAIFRFETETGQGSGVLRLVPAPDDDSRLVAWVLLTTLDEIKGHEEQINARRVV